MVATLIYAGLRREELLWLEPKDVDLQKASSTCAPSGCRGVLAAKTRKNRTVPISSALDAILSTYRPPKGSLWYFPSSAGVRWDTDGFSQALREVNRLSGLSWQELDPETGKTIERPGASLDFRTPSEASAPCAGLALPDLGTHGQLPRDLPQALCPPGPGEPAGEREFDTAGHSRPAAETQTGTFR